MILLSWLDEERIMAERLSGSWLDARLLTLRPVETRSFPLCLHHDNDYLAKHTYRLGSLRCGTPLHSAEGSAPCVEFRAHTRVGTLRLSTGR